MFDLVFLGTSASSPSVYRGLSAHLVMHRHYRFLIDCGEGTQRQILRSGLGFKRLDKVLLTHSHLDHILGLGGLISTITRWETLAQIDIFAGASTIGRVQDLLYKVVLRGAEPPVALRFVRVKGGDVLLDDDRFRLSAFTVAHRGPDCLGFVFEEKARRPFLADKALALGVPFGPERTRLVRGETVTLADGRIIEPADVLGEEIPGAKYVHIGDVGKTSDLVDVCHAADALVIEATYLATETDMARQFGHLTAGQAARLAQQAEVGALILTHISRRYSERAVYQEAQAVFPATFVARDFDHFRISRAGVERLSADVGPIPAEEEEA